MINRVLIRIKVVQMLYSYLLTKSEFRIDAVPESASRDVRYAYSAYIDLMLLLMELSGLSVANERAVDFRVNAKLAANKVGKALAADDTIRSIILRGATKVHLLDHQVNDIITKIERSHIFDDYSRKLRHDLNDDVNFWIVVFETIIAKDPIVADAMRADSEFTTVGFESAIEKVVNTLRSYNDSRQLLIKAKADLETSLTKAYELYLMLLKLIIELTNEYEERLENAKNKYLVTSADLNPNTKLIDNALVGYLRDNEQFGELLKEYKLAKVNTNPLLLRKLLDKILASDLYKKYIEAAVTDFATDVEFWRDVMRIIILPSDELAEELEDQSVYWNDDLQIMGTFVLKSLRRISQAEGKTVALLPKYKDEEDEQFGPELFMQAVDNRDTYRKYIDQFIDSTHWDPERMAYMDIVIMITAIAELVKFPKIPVPVTVNEYVEIANNYSTDKSGAFINGILFSVINYLNDQGIINKR